MSNCRKSRMRLSCAVCAANWKNPQVKAALSYVFSRPKCPLLSAWAMGWMNGAQSPMASPHSSGS
jgi:hypothetical protein